MSFFVYIHTCPNGKKYIGITSQETPECRWNKGEGYKGQHFYREIQKYGWDNIEHEYFTTQYKDLMFYWEKILIYYHNSTNKKFGYNKTGGGEHNTEFSEDAIKKMSESAKGRKMSEETKSKISKTLSGRTLPEEQKQKISEGNKGKTVSDETKRKTSEAMKLYWENKRKNNT